MHVLYVLARLPTRSNHLMPTIFNLIICLSILIGILVSCVYDDWAALIPVTLGAVLALSVTYGAVHALLTW